jgi:N-acetylneuraminic acid mutarotase
VKNSIVLLLALLLLLGCEERGDDPDIQNPGVTTQLAQINSTNGTVTLAAAITNPSKREVNYGFVWSSYNSIPMLNSDYSAALGSTKVGMSYNYPISLFSFEINVEYYVRAFITYDGRTYYGNTVSFRRGISPEIYGITPNLGRAGTQIRITGKELYYPVAVYFNSIESSWVYFWSENEVYATVPEGLPAGEITVSVVVSGNRATASEKFTNVVPVIKSFSPTSGTYDETVTIRGSGFSGDPYLSVQIGGINVYSYSHTDSTIEVKVPLDAVSDTTNIVVTAGGVATSKDKFIILPPEITSFEPKTGSYGSEVIVTGKNFHPSSWRSRVRFGNVEITPAEASQTKLKFFVPYDYNSPEGKTKLTVLGLSNAESQEEFELTPFMVDEVSPMEGVRGTEISITGSGFNTYAQYNHVLIGNLEAKITSSNSDHIYFKVPDGLGRGDHDIIVRVGGREVIMSEKFKFADPWVSRASFPGNGRVNAFSFAIGNRGYVGGGFGPNSQLKTDFYTYDPETDVWTKRADIPVGGQGVTAFATASYGYILKNKELWRYDPTTNKWASRADYPGEALRQQSAFVIGAKAYVGFGMIDSWNSTTECYEYDEQNDSWTSRGYLYPNSDYSVGMSDGENGYFAFGQFYGGIYRYDLNLGVQYEGDLSGQGFSGYRSEGIGLSANGRVYVGTGRYGWDNTCYADLYEYKKSTGQATRLSDIPGAGVMKAFGFVIGDKIYVGGGEHPGTGLTSSFYEYDPAFEE